MKGMYGRRLEALVEATDTVSRPIFQKIAAKSVELYKNSYIDYRKSDDSNYDHYSHANLQDRLAEITSGFAHEISVLDLGSGTCRYFDVLRNTQKSPA